MSHVINYHVYSDKQVKTQKDRQKIQSHWDDVAAREDYQEGCTGLGSPIQWKQEMKPFATKDEAMEYIEKLTYSSFYLQIAVPFYFYEDDEKLKELTAKVEEAKADLDKAKKPYYSVDTVKSKYITCKHCGSKLAVSYIKSNKCPLCGEDLRPQSVQDRVKRLGDKVKKLEETLKAKKEKRAKIYWLVKTEYHI